MYLFWQYYVILSPSTSCLLPFKEVRKLCLLSYAPFNKIIHIHYQYVYTAKWSLLTVYLDIVLVKVAKKQMILNTNYFEDLHRIFLF